MITGSSISHSRPDGGFYFVFLLPLERISMVGTRRLFLRLEKELVFYLWNSLEKTKCHFFLRPLLLFDRLLFLLSSSSVRCFSFYFDKIRGSLFWLADQRRRCLTGCQTRSRKNLESILCFVLFFLFFLISSRSRPRGRKRKKDQVRIKMDDWLLLPALRAWAGLSTLDVTLCDEKRVSR